MALTEYHLSRSARIALDPPGNALAALAPRERAGPLIIAEYEATTLVPPGASAALDEFGMIRLRLG